MPREEGLRSAGIAARILRSSTTTCATARSNASLLRGETNQIEFASSGREALELVRHWKPDLVLLDIMMPEMDGYQVCRLIRSDPSTAELRVFMLTALDDEGARLRAFQAGADDFLSKPLRREETQARIQSIARLNRYRAIIRYHQELARTRVPPAAQQPASAEPDGRLRRAIAQLDIWFQPIVRVAAEGATPVAHEALMRSPVGPFGDPLILLTAASSAGELPRLSAAIRQRLAATAVRVEGTVFMNLTVTELLDEALYAPDNPLIRMADRIVLEITEREPLENLIDFGRRVRRLRELGFRIAVDDLGGGYSGLESLVAVEPELAKISRSLAAGIDGDARRQKVVGSIAGLCRELGISLVVEGVETSAERATLLALGCELMQGYLFGRPHPIP